MAVVIETVRVSEPLGSSEESSTMMCEFCSGITSFC